MGTAEPGKRAPQRRPKREQGEAAPPPPFRGWARVQRYSVHQLPSLSAAHRDARAQAEGHELHVWIERVPEGKPLPPKAFGRDDREGWRWSIDGEGPEVWYAHMEVARDALAAAWRALGVRLGARQAGELDQTGWGDV